MTFSIPLQINYEDTDAGGVVYYGNYLGYMERARNAYLRELGYPPSKLVARYGMQFVVTEARLKYLAPARLDDLLEVTLEIMRLRAASVAFRQRVLRGGRVLVDAEVKLAVVGCESLRPKRLPGELRAAFNFLDKGN